MEEYMREQQTTMKELMEDNRRLRAYTDNRNEEQRGGRRQGGADYELPQSPRPLPPPPLPVPDARDGLRGPDVPAPPAPPRLPSSGVEPVPPPEGAGAGRGWLGNLLGGGRSASPPERRGSATTGDGATPAQQWLGPAPQLPREMAILVEGMSQLQSAMVKQMSGDGSPKGPETVKPGAQLPQLPPLGEDSPIDYQDWLTQVEAIMADMSDSSRTWFTLVMREVEKAYVAFLKASPIDRLSLRPEEPDNLVSGAYQRVHARAATMLMAV